MSSCVDVDPDLRIQENQDHLEHDKILKSVQGNATPGRAALKKWLRQALRVVISDGRILIGFFNCTDKDANIVLHMCAEYLEEGKDARILGSVMIPGKHIISIHVDVMDTGLD